MTKKENILEKLIKKSIKLEDNFFDESKEALDNEKISRGTKRIRDAIFGKGVIARCFYNEKVKTKEETGKILKDIGIINNQEDLENFFYELSAKKITLRYNYDHYLIISKIINDYKDEKVRYTKTIEDRWF